MAFDVQISEAFLLSNLYGLFFSSKRKKLLLLTFTDEHLLDRSSLVLHHYPDIIF